MSTEQLQKSILTDQQREDMLVTALEGGSNYWYFLPNSSMRIIYDATPETPRNTPTAVRMVQAVLAGAVVPIHDYEDETEKIGEISKESIQLGESKMLAENPEHYANIISGDWDAETADVWFQYCSLGEIVYG